MGKKKLIISLMLSLFLVLGVYLLLIFLKVLVLPEKLIILLCFANSFLLAGGAAIVLIGEYKYADSFTQRFLVLTTFQIVSFLVFLLAVRVAMPEDLKSFSIQFVVTFVILMILQSVALVKYQKYIPPIEK